MFSLSALLSTLLGLLARTFSDAVVKEVDSLRHDRISATSALRSRANASTLVAEAQEARAHAAADAAADGEGHPADLFPEKNSWTCIGFALGLAIMHCGPAQPRTVTARALRRDDVAGPVRAH